MIAMIAVWSQLEADMISERTRDALTALKAKGRRLGAGSTVERIDERGRARHRSGARAILRRVQALAAEV